MSPRPPWFDRPWGRRVVGAAFVSLMLACVAMLALLWGTERQEHRASAETFAYAPREDGDLPKLWRAPEFSLTDQHGRALTLASLRGQPFVADFIFTQCKSACPMITSRMVMLQRSLSGAAVRFVSFSVDPAHDTPGALAAYAARWNEHEARWALLSTTARSLADVTSGFRVAAEKTHDDDNPILHSNLFFLVDGDGFVRGVYPSDAGDGLSRLVTDARRLASHAPAAPADSIDPPSPSQGLYARLGCGGCHDDPKLAPPLVNLRGAERTLENGSKVTVDDAYLHRAIVEPAAEVVPGYATRMPSYAHDLSPAQVDALVAELLARVAAEAGAADPPAASVVIDPVCGMKVRAATDAPHATFQGRDVYFCSDSCRDAFIKQPGRYAADPTKSGGS